MFPSILVLLNPPSFRVVPHIVSSYVDIFLALSASTRLTPCRAWIHPLRFFSSLARFSRVYTSHCWVLSSSLPRTKVRLVHAAYMRATHANISGFDDQTRRKVTHLAHTSQRIRFKQVEVRPKDAPPHESGGPSTRGKGRGARSKQKSNAAGDDNIVDLITGNVDPGDLPQQRRRGGKAKGYRRGGDDESQPGPSQSQPGNVEQEVGPEEASLAPDLAMES